MTVIDFEKFRKARESKNESATATTVGGTAHRESNKFRSLQPASEGERVEINRVLTHEHLRRLQAAIEAALPGLQALQISPDNFQAKYEHLQNTAIADFRRLCPSPAAVMSSSPACWISPEQDRATKKMLSDLLDLSTQLFLALQWGAERMRILSVIENAFDGIEPQRLRARAGVPLDERLQKAIQFAADPIGPVQHCSGLISRAGMNLSVAQFAGLERVSQEVQHTAHIFEFLKEQLSKGNLVPVDSPAKA